MCPPPDAENPLSTMTLKKFSTIGCNVVIFYASSQKPKNAWSQSFVSSPWGNVQTTEQMLTVSDSSCTKCTGRVLHLYVSTIVDTIDYSIILANYKSLYQYCKNSFEFQFLDKNLDNGRPAEKIYISQGLLTPDAKAVASNLRGTLFSWQYPSLKEVDKWVESKTTNDQQHGINIVIKDFTEKNFALTVIHKNLETRNAASQN